MNIEVLIDPRSDSRFAVTADFNTALERLRDDHVTELRVADLAREGLFSESQSAQAAQADAIKDIQKEHAAILAKKEAAFG